MHHITREQDSARKQHLSRWHVYLYLLPHLGNAAFTNTRVTYAHVARSRRNWIELLCCPSYRLSTHRASQEVEWGFTHTGAMRYEFVCVYKRLTSPNLLWFILMDDFADQGSRKRLSPMRLSHRSYTEAVDRAKGRLSLQENWMCNRIIFKLEKQFTKKQNGHEQAQTEYTQMTKNSFFTMQFGAF